MPTAPRSTYSRRLRWAASPTCRLSSATDVLVGVGETSARPRRCRRPQRARHRDRRHPRDVRRRDARSAPAAGRHGVAARIRSAWPPQRVVDVIGELAPLARLVARCQRSRRAPAGVGGRACTRRAGRCTSPAASALRHRAAACARCLAEVWAPQRPPLRAVSMTSAAVHRGSRRGRPRRRATREAMSQPLFSASSGLSTCRSVGSVDEATATEVVERLRARRIFASLNRRAGVYNVGVRVVIPDGREAIWDNDGACRARGDGAARRRARRVCAADPRQRRPRRRRDHRDHRGDDYDAPPDVSAAAATPAAPSRARRRAATPATGGTGSAVPDGTASAQGVPT